MNFPHLSFAALLVLMLSVLGCSNHDADAGSANADISIGTNSESVTDRWLGQWNGPEGTFLRLEGSHGKYEVTIQNLDGPRTFQGSSVGGQIQFNRDGLNELLRATNGAATGMKWLSDKSNCLAVRPGEGYCRD